MTGAAEYGSYVIAVRPINHVQERCAMLPAESSNGVERWESRCLRGRSGGVRTGISPFGVYVASSRYSGMVRVARQGRHTRFYDNRRVKTPLIRGDVRTGTCSFLPSFRTYVSQKNLVRSLSVCRFPRRARGTRNTPNCFCDCETWCT